MRGALGELPGEQSKVIELAYFGGFSHSEIAEMLGVPLGTVKGRMRLGLEKIRGRAGGGTGMSVETDHERWRDDLAAYLLGALEPGESADLERHVASCCGVPRRAALAGAGGPGAARSGREGRAAAASCAPGCSPRPAPTSSRRRRQLRVGCGASSDLSAREGARRQRRSDCARSPASPLVALVAAAVAGYTIGGERVWR